MVRPRPPVPPATATLTMVKDSISTVVVGGNILTSLYFVSLCFGRNFQAELLDLNIFIWQPTAL